MSSRFISPFFDAGNGITPSSGAKLYFYELDGVTPRDTYSDEAATTPNANPVVSDTNGLFSDIWIVGSYKVILQDRNSVQIWEGTPIREIPSVVSAAFSKNFATLEGGPAATSAVENINLVVDDALNMAERTLGNGNGSMGDVVLASTVTPNGEDIIQCTGVPTLAIVIRDFQNVVNIDTVAELKATDLAAGQNAKTGGYYTGWAALSNDSSAEYTIKTAAQATTDGDVIDTWGNHTLANGNVAIVKSGITRANVTQWGAKGDGAQDDSLPTIALIQKIAADFPQEGGVTVYFPAAAVEYKFVGSIDLDTLFSLVDPATSRLTQLWFEGDGRASKIKYAGAGAFLFKYGDFTKNVGMTGGFRKLKLVGAGTLGHTATAYTPNFSTVSGVTYGSDDTTTTAIFGDVILTDFVIDDVEIELFNKGIHFRNGFSSTITNCNITKCNVGIEGSDTMTSMNIGNGNTMETCAVGVFLNSGNQMTKFSGVNVIEANDVDILIYAISHLHDMFGVYHEGSRYSHFFSADATTDIFTPKQNTVERCIGLNVGFSGGGLDIFFKENSFSGGADFGLNAGQRYQHILFEDCYTGNRADPFDASLVTGSGIYSQYADEITIKSKGIDVPNMINGDPKVRPNSDMRKKKRFYETSANTLIAGFVLDVPNLKTGALVTIEGHKNYDIEVGAEIPNLVYFKYVGVIQRDTGAATTVTWSATENIFESFATTQTPHTVTTPTVFIGGAVGDTQVVQFDFIQGYTGDISAGHYYEVSVNASIGNVDFS